MLANLATLRPNCKIKNNNSTCLCLSMVDPDVATQSSSVQSLSPREITLMKQTHYDIYIYIYILVTENE